MIDYIKQLANTVLLVTEGKRPENVHKTISTYELLAALNDELYRLDPRDFEPGSRNQFIVARVAIKRESGNPEHNIGIVPEIVRAVLPHLDQYAGEGTFAKARDFAFVNNVDVRSVVERDYRELSLRALPDGAWKSAVILAGSILEAVLYDRLTRDATMVKSAMTAKSTPNRKGGGKKDITATGWEDEWTLSDLIKVAAELKVIPHENEKAIHLVLREYRNYVHVRKEIESTIFISEGHATASKGMLDVLLDHLL